MILFRLATYLKQHTRPIESRVLEDNPAYPIRCHDIMKIWTRQPFTYPSNDVWRAGLVLQHNKVVVPVILVCVKITPRSFEEVDK